MRRTEVGTFFAEYVFGFMFSDVRREIDRARAGKDAGNFLAALGLLCYTEVLGGIERGKLEHGNGRQNFEAFFRRLGPGYAAFDDPYQMLRCGMAHEYLVKGRSIIAMLGEDDGRPGVYIDADGRTRFIVEIYFRDFRAAALNLYALLGATGRGLPHGLAGRTP